jgi:hypothetical protein
MLLSFFYDYLAYQARHWGCTPVILATPEAKIGKIVVQGQLGRDGGVWKKKKKNSRELKRGGSQYSLWQKARLYFQNNQCKKGWR